MVIQKSELLSPSRKGKVQSKLKIGARSDHFEREADLMAEKVTRMPLSGVDTSIRPSKSRFSKRNSVQRKCSACEEEQIQRKRIHQGTVGPEVAVSTKFSNLLSSSKSSGAPLERKPLEKMELGFGRDFKEVKIHTDGKANKMNRGIGALAFTHGNHIYFRTGMYNPGTLQGRKLLAHELTHTIQQSSRSSQLSNQNAGTIQRNVRCTFGEIEAWAITSQSNFAAPAGLADARASIGAVCSSRNCRCVGLPANPPPGTQAAWNNITAATGGTDQTGGGTFMCVGTQNCWFVSQCYECNGNTRRLVARPTALAPSGSTTVAGKGTLYFYQDNLRGWCNRTDYRTACRPS